jgi:hypothetical protein
MSRALDEALDGLARACASFSGTARQSAPGAQLTSKVMPGKAHPTVQGSARLAAPTLARQSSTVPPAATRTDTLDVRQVRKVAGNPTWPDRHSDQAMSPRALSRGDRPAFELPDQKPSGSDTLSPEPASIWRRITLAATRLLHRFTFRGVP